MNIKWHGLSCFSVKSKYGKILVDPQTVGMKISKVTPDIVLATEDIEIENGEYSVFTWPGEYEAKNISVQIIPVFEKFIIIFEAEKTHFCHLGNINETLSDEILDKIGNVDVLFVPIGDAGEMLDHKKAVDVIEQIEPRCVIPMNYKIGEFGDDLATNEAYLKEIGLKDYEPISSYDCKDLPDDKIDYIVLSPQ